MTTQSNSDLFHKRDAISDESSQERDEDYFRHPDHPARDEGPAQEVSFAELPTYNYSQPFSRNITRAELTSGSIALVLWVIFFTMGLFVPTSGMRAELWSGSTDSLPKALGFALVVGASYTLTNTLFLSCLASLLGGMAHRWQVGDGLETIPPDAQCVAATRIYMAALLRGFFLYLMFISGFLLVSTDKTVIETQLSQYIRIAGMISIVGFIVGYDPNLLIRLMRRILNLANLPLDEKRPASTQKRID